jgi:hypothetical protein
MTECLGYEAQIGGAEVVEGKVFLENMSRVNKRCHKNVVILADSGAAESSLVAVKGDISSAEPCVTNRTVRFLPEGLQCHVGVNCRALR